MQPRQFLDIAESWATDSSDCEAHRRSAISRAYYAAWHTSKANLLALGIPLDSTEKSSHLKVIRALQRNKAHRLKYFGRLLDTMRIERNSADYKIASDDNVVIDDVLKSISISKEILLSWETYLRAKNVPSPHSTSTPG